MARKRQETLVLFKDVLNITEKFSDAQFGALMRAAFDYRFEGEGYQGEDALVELAFRMLEAQIDRYREACETNTKNAQREEPMQSAAAAPQETPETMPQETPGESCANEGERNAAESSEMQPNAPHDRTHNHTHHYNHTQAHFPTQDAGSEKPALAPFSPPSVEEVRAYAKENKIDFDSAKFVDFYTANDWRLGTAKMKDWKLAVRVWSAAPAMQT